jgi:N-acetylneuraminic acid mutarotase
MKRTGVTKLLILIAVSVGVAAGVVGGSAAAPTVHRLAGAIGPLAALGTGFTYQGFLQQSSTPVNGANQCDGQFSLFDAASAGAQLGSTQTVLNIDFNVGYFTVNLNGAGEFGPTPFTGQARWLEIAVRCPAGSGTFSSLGRQALAAAPYAFYTSSAPWSGLSGVPAGFADNVDNDVPSGALILSASVTAPSGYTYSGWQVTNNDRWLPKAAMLTARSDLAAAAANNKIYAIGGYNGSGYRTTVEEYDPATNTWTSKAAMPTARSDLAAAAVNNKIYAIGGFNGSGYLTTVEEYDPATNTWTSKAAMPTARNSLATAAVNNKIYAIGGNGASGWATVEEYNPATNTWTSKAAMPTARIALAAAVVNNKIYAIGGFYGFGYLTTVEEYDPATNTWTPKVAMPTARGYLAAAAVNNKIYAIGGTNGSGYRTTVEEYDPATNTWILEAAMPTARGYLATAAANNKIYAIGGYNGSGYLTTVEEYQVPNNFYVHQKN